MGIAAYTKTPAVPYNTYEGNVVSWLLTTTNPTGQPLVMPEAADRSIQFLGVFGGGTVVLEGTNDIADAPADDRYTTLRDPVGTTISKTSKDGVAVTEHMRLVRPHLSGGDGTTAVEVFMLLKR